MRKIRKYLGLALMIFVCGSAAYAQFTSGVQGTVQDQSGAAIPGAAVTLTNTGTNITSHTTSDARGVYQFVSLPPGTY